MSVAKRIGPAAVALAATLMSIGCIGFRGPAALRRDVEERTASRLDREFAMSLGPATMAFARWVVRHSDEEDVPIRGVRRLQIGVYHRRPDDRGVRLDRHLEPADFPGYEPIVRIQETDERVLVMAAVDGDRIRRMVVVVDDLDEVVLVRMSGRLESIVEDAMRMAFREADRDDLADPAVEAWERGEPDEVL